MFKKNKPPLDNLGLIEDPRLDFQKEKDYQAEEVFCFAPEAFQWKEKAEADWHKYPIFNQDGSSSCVAQAVTKALGIENYLEEGKFVHYSARDIYSQRSNFPSKGMWFQDGMSIGYKKGATLEQLMLSQGLNEVTMNNGDDRKQIDKEIALIGKGGNYLTLNVNIDTIAQVIEPTGKPVVLGVKFGDNEWNRVIPKILVDKSQANYGHAIVATNAFLYKGKKALLIEDSWGVKSGKDGRRIITEDWFNLNRIIAAHCYLELRNDWRNSEDKLAPSHKFKVDLKFNTKNDDNVMLQECLKYEGIFPSNVDSTGYYGNITARAVYEYQVKYKVAPLDELDLLKGRLVGPATRAMLNLRYK